MAKQQDEQNAQKEAAKNTVTIEQAGPCRKKIIVEIPRETISKMTDEQYSTFQKDALVPGFRKGHAPRRLLEKRFGKDVGEQIKLKLLADASDAAIKDNKLDVLRDPNIDYEKITLPDEGNFKFDFEIEVRPEFELPALDGIPVEKVKLDVTPAQIDKEIELMLKYAGAWTPKDNGKIEMEDQVVADAMLNVEGQEQKLDNTTIYIRPNSFIGEIPVEKMDEELVGSKAGDEKSIELTVPKTHFREELRGKKVGIKMTIKDIKYLKPAEMNADFLTKCGIETEEKLRELIEKRTKTRLEAQAKNEMAEQVYQYLLEKINFDLPMDVAADQTVAVLRRQYMNLMMQGLQREQIDQHLDQLKASSEVQAQQQLKVFFIMDKVAEKLGVKTTDEEINGHIAKLAVEKKIRPERLREEMERDGSLEQFKLQIRDDKCVAKLLETAKITEVAERTKPKEEHAHAHPHPHAHPHAKPKKTPEKREKLAELAEEKAVKAEKKAEKAEKKAEKAEGKAEKAEEKAEKAEKKAEKAKKAAHKAEEKEDKKEADEEEKDVIVARDSCPVSRKK